MEWIQRIHSMKEKVNPVKTTGAPGRDFVLPVHQSVMQGAGHNRPGIRDGDALLFIAAR